MSNTTERKRSLDHIDDDEKNKDQDNVPPQDAAHDQSVTDDTNITNNDTETTTTTEAPDSTNDKQRSSISNVHERKRGQRMFGMLMGTLDKFNKAQQQNQDQARKRQAIDTKQQERLLEEKKAIQASMLQRRQERAEKNQQRQADLDERRIKQSSLQRQKLAHYLITTTTTPRLTYLPKQLLPQQQKQIDQQINSTEETPTTAERGEESDHDQEIKEQQ
ncbi:pinin/SDK/memA/ protein conserved region-domain-containing protein [Absidia repens]|uniref:Pinin/SDK/memA/ protein conserved region-domain-containing protein n=1 Tax=Absidia repens TaxID=90262 RepID=A0A1X2I6R0_9FUNG|nr:pinin/SDK/memA/ protein conserved region-domain-containing protein [Absidia repens]